ncbi:MAG: ribosome maturation factor RimP [Actinophytocola sp.]|nr:ribosome maturation factor RimP [Actinophytocola sp.]
MPNDLAKRLEPIVADAVSSVGFDLDALEVQQAGRRKLVKVTVDADDGVEVDKLAHANRAVSAALDDHDHLIVGSYELEVTSPGLSRPLTKQRHWRRARFRLVRITPKDGKEYVGRVGHAGENSARVLVDSRIRDVSYQSVAKAVVEIEFKQPRAEELKQLEADETDVVEAAKTAGQRHTGGKKKEDPK